MPSSLQLLNQNSDLEKTIVQHEKTLNELIDLYLLRLKQIPQNFKGVEAIYDLKSKLIKQLPIYHGLVRDDPQKHFLRFHEVCNMEDN